ncbi:LysM peptidoglycan-binding domain-containing protein [Massilia sp. H6]|uniref:LysM peptidoglycan-binding domain-containing protein n=1 Tax=Massilia sp. H6 TaxID=2970464 RepID=UPI00216A678A|nr:LysM peptidoglycan-binding domain-containing protein [Massilia sp. H6]UVW28434.1 LysM peptidoglycan-binding domain-containing protein [Massilia sp. H6]
MNRMVTAQDQLTKYDAQGRIDTVKSSVAGADYQHRYEYDSHGNRLRVTTSYTNGNGAHKLIVVDSTYDQMNRLKTVGGTVTTTGDQVQALPGNKRYDYEDTYDPSPVEKITYIATHAITYDGVGNRLTDTIGGKLESYRYDAAGRLETITRDNVTVGYRRYDGAGRIVEMKDGTEVRTSTYDALGFQIRQRTTAASDGKVLSEIFYGNSGYDNYGYDAQGKLSYYQVKQGSTTTLNSITYQGFDSYKEKSVESSGNGAIRRSTRTYDAFGNLAATSVQRENSSWSNQSFVNDISGQMLKKTTDGLDTHSLIVGGQFIGSSDRTSESFSTVVDPISSPALTAAPTTYTVITGDTLQGIAKAVWGDATLWWLIADANAVGNELTAGMTLTLPTRVNTVNNDYATFKPYDSAQAVGDTTPKLPVPPADKGGCGVIGTIIMVVVAVVVTIYTAGAMTSAVAGFANTMAAGASALGGGMGMGAAVAAGAVGGAAGSIASQGVGMAMGMQDSFSWKAVGMGALGGAISGGLAGYMPTTGVAAAIAKGAVGSALSQGIGSSIGITSFSWRNVAAAAAGAGAGAAMSSGLGDAFSSLGRIGAGILRSTISGMAAGAVTQRIGNGKVDWVRVAADAFGNALGSSLAASLRPTVEQPSSGEKAGPISRAQAERSMYGGMTVKEVLGGEKDWLGSLGTYEGAIGNGGAGLSWDGDLAARRAAQPTYLAALPQVVVQGERMTAEEKVESLFNINRRNWPAANSPTENYASRFGQGVIGAIKGVVVEPVRQVRDMAYAGASVFYNELLRSKGTERWDPAMYSGVANAYSNGTSQLKLLLQSNFVTGTGAMSYDATTALMNRQYGDLAEMAGGIAGGFAIGKVGQKYGGYGVALADIGGPRYGPMASQRGSIGLRLVTPDSAGIDITLKFKPEWTDAQRADAIVKAQILNDAPTVVTKSDRSGTAGAMDRYRKAVEAPAKSDIDHRVDLQLGGSKAIENLGWLDSSVNRSFGVQIYQQIKYAQPGTLVNRVTIGD